MKKVGIIKTKHLLASLLLQPPSNPSMTRRNNKTRNRKSSTQGKRNSGGKRVNVLNTKKNQPFKRIRRASEKGPGRPRGGKERNMISRAR